MEHRTDGTTYNCKGCRYWSEMIARAHGGPVEALCLVQGGPKSGKYCRAEFVCDRWERGHLGAVDEPCEDPLRYAVEEKVPTIGDGTAREYYGFKVDLSPADARRAIRTSPVRADGQFCRIRFRDQWWRLERTDLENTRITVRACGMDEPLSEYVTMFSMHALYGARLVQDAGDYRFVVVDRVKDHR
jgi:hypothetical protein